MTPEHRNSCVRAGAIASGLVSERAGLSIEGGVCVAIAAYCLLALLRDIATSARRAGSR